MKEFVEKLIGRLEEEISWYETHGCNEDLKRGIIGANRHAIEIVNQLAEEYGKDTNVTTNNGWIPCEKELPSKSGKYIVTQERYSIDDIFHTGRKRTEVDYVEFNANDNMWSRANFFNVIAWLPLPAPYQKGSE